MKHIYLKLSYISPIKKGESLCKRLKGLRYFVDDEPSILEFLEMGLVNEGFEVQTAQDGMTAVTLAKQFEPHIAVLDVMMPGMDGFEVCRMLKKGSNIAVIMLTAKDDVDDRIKGLNLGADDYMSKPFSFEELLARIQARIRNQFPNLMGRLQSVLFVWTTGAAESYTWIKF